MVKQNYVDRTDHAGYRKTPLSIDEYLEFRFEGDTLAKLKETFRFPAWFEKVFRAYKRGKGKKFEYAKKRGGKKCVKR